MLRDDTEKCIFPTLGPFFEVGEKVGWTVIIMRLKVLAFGV